MTASQPPRLLAIGLCLLVLFAPLAAAQQAVEEAPVAADLLEARIAETESASDLSDETKSRLLSLYRRALSNLEQAESDRAAARAFREALQAAPTETKAIRESLDASTAAAVEEPLIVERSTPLRDLEARLQKESAVLGYIYTAGTLLERFVNWGGPLGERRLDLGGRDPCGPIFLSGAHTAADNGVPVEGVKGSSSITAIIDWPHVLPILKPCQHAVTANQAEPSRKSALVSLTCHAAARASVSPTSTLS